MATFFIQTEPRAIGPFTGIELREAALARVIGPQTMISTSPEGPWTVASDAGLFSDAKIALPHPEGTYVPSYQIRGAEDGQVTGPFKLRELVGFAVRGMLPKNTYLKSELSDDWFPVTNIRMLRTCLRGQLLLPGQAQKGIQQGNPQHVLPNSNNVRPSDLAVAEKAVDITAANVAIVDESDEYVDQDLSTELDDWEGPEEQDEVDQEAPPRKPFLPKFVLPRVSIAPMQAAKFFVAVMVIVGIGTAYSFWRNSPVKREQCLGDWIGTNASGKPFGVSFREDGSCVVFNTEAESWTGDFVWTVREETPGNGGLNYELAPVGAEESAAPIDATDGYLRFQGFASEPPKIGSHEYEDCFLRPTDGGLQLGYLSKVKNENGAKVLMGGWTELKAFDPPPVDPMSELSAMEPESRAMDGSMSADAIHLADAVMTLQNPVQSDSVEKEIDAWHGLICFSKTVDAAFLLNRFGIPDEARNLHKFEIAMLPDRVDFTDAVLVRYGELKLVLTPAGKIQFVSIVH